MAHKTATLERLNTVLVDILSLMAFGAIVHFHAVPRVAFYAGNIFTPDIYAVPTDAVLPVNSE